MTALPQSDALARRGQNPLAALSWMTLSGLLFVAVTGIVRYLGSDIPPIVASFIRYLSGLVILSPVILRTGFKWPRGKKLGLFAARGLAHATAVSLWFFAMARIPITDVIAIGYTAPIYVTLGAALFLGERLHVRRMLAVIAGFAGAIIILRPGFQVIETGALAQVIAAPVFAASFLMAKKLTGDENPMVIVIMLTVFCALALLPGAIYQWRTPGLFELALLVLVAILATIGHYAQTRAYQSAPITASQPVWFLQLVWGALVGWFAFGEIVDPWTIAGGAVIITAVIYISRREAQAQRDSRQT
ncbi:MAG TPA: DMT family transporter [Rhizobiales bacterium]|nr:DMT family transporter [Hyphomicrobiales bacterium]